MKCIEFKDLEAWFPLCSENQIPWLTRTFKELCGGMVSSRIRMVLAIPDKTHNFGSIEWQYNEQLDIQFNLAVETVCMCIVSGSYTGHMTNYWFLIMIIIIQTMMNNKRKKHLFPPQTALTLCHRVLTRETNPTCTHALFHTHDISSAVCRPKYVSKSTCTPCKQKKKHSDYALQPPLNKWVFNIFLKL